MLPLSGPIIFSTTRVAEDTAPSEPKARFLTVLLDARLKRWEGLYKPLSFKEVVETILFMCNGFLAGTRKDALVLKLYTDSEWYVHMLLS